MREIHRNLHNSRYELRAQCSFRTHRNQIAYHKKLALREFDQLRAEEIEENVEDRERKVLGIFEKVFVEQFGATLRGNGFDVAFGRGSETEVFGRERVGFKSEEVIANHLYWTGDNGARYNLRWTLDKSKEINR